MSRTIDILIDPKNRASIERTINSSDLLDRISSSKLEAIRNEFNSGELSAALNEEHISREAVDAALLRNATIEAIVRLHDRPVLQVVDNTYTVTVHDSTIEVPILEKLKKDMEEHRANIEKAIPAVGRIELKNHPSYSWIGTGWLVRDNIVVTNRHVALEFAKKTDQAIEFRYHQERKISARIDIREERSRPDEIEFNVIKVLFISDDDNFDVAFLKVNTSSADGEASLPLPIKLSKSTATAGTQVVTIGYPARDSRCTIPEDMERIFGSIYDVKRVAPGEGLSDKEGILQHDCTTLGGNSGSVVLNIATGEAVGLHYAGTQQEANWAVSAAKVAELLDSLAL